jgi:hypothetical protein
LLASLKVKVVSSAAETRARTMNFPLMDPAIDDNDRFILLHLHNEAMQRSPVKRQWHSYFIYI